MTSRGAEWSDVRAFLEDLSRRRVQAGYSSDETATFVFSLKRALFEVAQGGIVARRDRNLRRRVERHRAARPLGLHTVKTYQRAREDVINRQQQELLELSTPVVKLWDGILALPMIGTLDSARTQVVMESLLQKIVETESQIAIIDITGVPTVDTLVAQHLLKTVTAMRLMGADCIISGVRPQIAQTIVHLGVDLQGVTTKANLADALALALKRSGIAFTQAISRWNAFPFCGWASSLLVTIQVDMHDQLALHLQDDLTRAIEKKGAKGVLIDISALEMVDSFIGRMIVRHLRHGAHSRCENGGRRACSRPLRSPWWNSGCRLPGVATALNVERGMRSAAALSRRVA